MRLSVLGMNVIGNAIKKVVRYLNDGEVPDTHIQMRDVESVMFYGSDAKFNVKKEV